MKLSAISKTSWGLLAATLILWALLFWPTLLQLESVWQGSDTYSHAYFIPVIVLWLLYRRQTDVQDLPKADWRLLILLVPLLFLWLIGFASDTGALAQLAAIVCLQLILAGWMGLRLAKHHQFAVFYLIFMLPFGEELHPLLQNITADLSVWFLHLAAIPVFREGLYLTTPVGHFEVAVACSGLRFLITSLAIGTLYAHLTYLSFVRQLLFLLALILFSVLANGLRAFLLIYIAEQTNMAYGFGDDHYVYGWLVFGLVLMIMFWLGGKFSDLPTENRNKPTTQSSAGNPNDNTAQTTERKTKGQGFTLAQFGYLTALFAGFMLWRLSLPLTPVPAAPSAALIASDVVPVPDSDWGIAFVASQKQSLLKAADGFEFFRAEYAHRQQKGELVSWSNKLFKDKHWTITARRPWLHNGLEAEIITLKSLSGSTRTVLYWYQVGDQTTVSSWRVKLAQTVALLSGSSGAGQFNAVSVQAELNADDQKLQSAVTRLQQWETPHGG
ncbi:exosortase A [Rheinheimera sp.]|uniref:exosortase A n=1 Tax=Rheinheimera sp. TaxID=1869214 RepID=UPI002FDD823A